MTQFITCPKCSHEVHIEDAMAKRIESSMKAELADRALKLDQKELELGEAQVKQETLLAQRIKERTAQFRQELRVEIRAEQHVLDQERENELAAKTERISELVRNEAELRRQKRELEEARASVDLEVEKRVAAERSTLELKAREKAQADAVMTIKEKEHLIQQLKTRVDDMTRKMAQGSMQAQGEAQELALEELMQQSHPHDGFEEVKKGELGADLVQIVKNPFGRECGIILYESKRTKAFSEEWVGKLKLDMGQRKADIGVIVTRALPKGSTQFELRENNIYLCTFEEVRALSYCLRATLVQVNEVRVVQANQGDKSRMLYAYLMGQEFKNQLHLIHSTFQTMHSALAREKGTALRRFKQREKELGRVLDTFAEVVGSLNGIAGHVVAEFEDFEEWEKELALLE